MLAAAEDGTKILAGTVEVGLHFNAATLADSHTLVIAGNGDTAWRSPAYSYQRERYLVWGCEYFWPGTGSEQRASA